MKRLNLILNGKGGVGKSFFAVNFVQFLKDRGIAHVAIDSDNENSTLKRFHPDARFIDLNNRRELDGIFSALENANLVVMDCRAASTDLFIDYFAEIDLPAVLSAMGAALTLVMPVNHESDSVDQIQRLADQFGKKCNYVVVRNAAPCISKLLVILLHLTVAELSHGKEGLMSRSERIQLRWRWACQFQSRWRSLFFTSTLSLSRVDKPGRSQNWPQPRLRRCSCLPRDSTAPLPKGASSFSRSS